MVVRDSQWIVLAAYIQTGNREGLSLLMPEWFEGSPYLVLDVAQNLPSLSVPIVMEALESVMAPEDYLDTHIQLRADISGENIEQHTNALSYRYGHKRIAEVIDLAAHRLHTGENRFRISEELQTDLAGIHIGSHDETFEEILEEAVGMERLGILTGIPQFAQFGIDQWMAGDIMSIGGDTGTYKTTYAIHLCDEALRANPDLHVLYFMKEQPRYQVLHKLLARHTRHGYTDVIKYLNRENPLFVEQIKSETKNNDTLARFHIISQQEFSTPYDVAGIIRRYNAQYKKIMWVIDYLTCLDFGGKPENFLTYLNIGLRVIKNAVLATKSFGIIINQLKDGWNIGMDKAPRRMFPNRSHIIWSSEIKNLSSYILMLYHPGTYFPYDRKVLYATFNKLRHTDGTYRAPFIIEGEKQRMREPTEREHTTVTSIEQEIIHSK